MFNQYVVIWKGEMLESKEMQRGFFSGLLLSPILWLILLEPKLRGETSMAYAMPVTSTL